MPQKMRNEEEQLEELQEEEQDVEPRRTEKGEDAGGQLRSVKGKKRRKEGIMEGPVRSLRRKGKEAGVRRRKKRHKGGSKE